MDDIVALLNTLEIDTNDNNVPTNQQLAILQHDLSILLDCWALQEPHLDMSKLIIAPGDFKTMQELYECILATLHRILSQVSIMDIMPYIDDYIEYYDGICGMF